MKAARLILALALCWLLCASKNRADAFGNRAWGKSAYQSVITPDDELQTLVRYQENPTGYGEIASGREVWTKFDPEGLFAGTNLDAGEWFGAVFSGAGQGLYDNTAGAAVQGYHAGEQHMEGGFTEIANAHSGLDVTIGVLGIVAATGDATGAVMAVTPEGKVEKVAAEGAEKLVAKEGEQAVAKTVEQKTEGTVSSSAKADAEKSADATATPASGGSDPKAAAAAPAPTDKRFSKEKQALVDMAQADKKTGMTPGDMQAYKDLNKELPDPFPENKVRGPEAHPDAKSPSSQQDHGHVGPVNHIPINDDTGS